MTTQMSDVVIYNDKSYALAGYTNEIPFNPESHDLQPIKASTMCWRGFVMTFKIQGDELQLNRLDINDNNKKLGRKKPLLFGVKPKRNDKRGIFKLFQPDFPPILFNKNL